MIRNKIQTDLFGGVGFKNPTLTGYDIVDAANQESTSGLYFQDGSELVTIQNIKDCQPDAGITDEQFNDLLESMQKGVILDVANKVIQGKSDFIASLNLFPFEKTFDTFELKKGKFVGFEIEPYSYGKIPWVELSFDSEATFNLYLFNSNLKAPVQTKEVTTSAGESKVITLDWEIADDNTYKGGKFYLGYFDGDTAAKACKKDYNSAIVKVTTPYYVVQSVNLTHTGTVLDIRSKRYDSDYHGLNFGMDIYNDYTDLVVRNKDLFWRAIQLQMHEKVLSMIKYSVRDNFIKRMNMNNVKFADLELYGNKEAGVTGLQDKLKKAIEHIQKALFFQPRVQRRTLR